MLTSSTLIQIGMVIVYMALGWVARHYSMPSSPTPGPASPTPTVPPGPAIPAEAKDLLKDLEKEIVSRARTRLLEKFHELVQPNK